MPPLYDVVVVGGSLSGAATATLLLRKNPGLKLLIVEKSTHFTRRVGEATVEVSAFFLGRILGMTQHLNESHLVKQGMRFWFTNDEVDPSTRRANSAADTRFAFHPINWIGRFLTRKSSAARARPARHCSVRPV